MYKQILVATDGSKLSMKAVAHAIALAQAVGAALTVFYASPDYPLPAYADGVVYEPVSKKEYAALANKEAAKILESVADRGVQVTKHLEQAERRDGRRIAGDGHCGHGRRREVLSIDGQKLPTDRPANQRRLRALRRPGTFHACPPPRPPRPPSSAMSSRTWT